MSLNDDIYEIISRFDDWEDVDPYEALTTQVVEYVLSRDEDMALNQKHLLLYNELAAHFVATYYHGLGKKGQNIRTVKGQICRGGFKICVRVVEPEDEPVAGGAAEELIILPREVVQCKMPFDAVYYLAKKRAAQHKYDKVVSK